MAGWDFVSSATASSNFLKNYFHADQVSRHKFEAGSQAPESTLGQKEEDCWVPFAKKTM